MKKFLTLLLISITFFSYAQQFQLTDPRGTDIYSDGQTISATITAADLNDFGEYVVSVMIQNLSDIELDLKTLRENMALPTGIFAYVCFGICDDSGEVLAMDWPIEGGDQASFDLHLKPNNHTGFCKFKIDFVAPEQKMTLYISIEVAHVGVQEQNNAKVSLSAFPNPAPVNSKVNVNYTLADKNSNNRLIIRNIVGAEVISMPLNSNENKISIEISSLVPGIYFYAIENKNQISIAKKLIVK